MPYLNVAEIETRLEMAALSHPGLCTRIALPLATPEGRLTHAVRIRDGARANRHGVLLIGGQHAREWGSSDALVALADDILAAYAGGTGLVFLGKSYTAADVQQIVRNLDLFVFPCVNPDGRFYSQTVYSMWRRNRRPIPATSQIGVDLNRNYDFLWNYRLHLNPVMYDGNYANGEAVISDQPGNDTYHGTAPFSEVETRNVKWLLDTFPRIRFFVDVHSYSQLIYYPWGDDQTQTADPAQSFLDAAYDGQRGVPGDAYAEYMRPQDDARQLSFAQRMRAALQAVRGRVYTVGHSYALYPTCATSTCYAFSRHIADTARNKVDAFLIEWGTTFQPDYATEMTQIIKDVSAALTELCLWADRVPLLEIAPARLAFGRVRLGTARTRGFTVRNLGATPAAVSAIAIEPASAVGRYAVAPAAVASIAPGASLSVSVTFTPSAAGPLPAGAAVEFHEVGQPALRDVRSVALVAEGCAAAKGACYAPVFEASSWLVCLLLWIVLLPVIALLAIFVWIPGVACTIKQLLYRLRHCGDGNDDGCVAL